VVAGLEASDGTFTNSVKLTWNEIVGADRYDVYLCVSSGEINCTYISSQTTGEMIFLNATSNEQYYFRVRSCFKNTCSNLSLTDSGYASFYGRPDSMRFISETVPDGSVLLAEQDFVKTWTVENDGSSIWDTSFCLKYLSGISMGLSNSVCVTGSVSPGQSHVFSMPMQAPASSESNAMYRDSWALYKGSTIVSGTVWAEILVEGVTPVATAPDSFSVSASGPSSINLSWVADNSGIDYRLYRSSTINGQYSLLRQLSALSFEDDGLVPSTTYYYKLQRCVDGNLESCSDLSSVRSATTQTSATTASLISSFTVSNLSPVTGTSININAVAFNGGGIALNDRFQFVFALSTNNSLGAGDEILLEIEDGSNFTFEVGTSETFSKLYSVPDNAALGPKQVLACLLYNDLNSDLQQYCESQAINIVDEPVQVPSTPSKPNLSYTQGESQIGVSWNGSTGGDYYRVERSTNPGSGFVQVYGGGAFSFLNTGVSNGTTYYYRLRSCQNSLSSTCSGYSSNAEVTTLATAINDFTSEITSIAFTGTNYRVRVTQRYSGTSTRLLESQLGLFLSNDNACNISQDTFLAEATSGLNVSDTFDSEEIFIDLPTSTSSGEWYVCSFADYDDQHQESNESNNSSYRLIKTEVAPPVLTPIEDNDEGKIRVNFDPGSNLDISYVNRSFTDAGDSPVLVYDTLYETTFNGNIGPYEFFDDNLDSCKTYYYSVEACIDQNNCSSSPWVKSYTLAFPESPAPWGHALSDRKIQLEWSDDSCGSFFVLERKNARTGDLAVIYVGSATQYVDREATLAPNTSYEYTIRYCDNEARYRDSGCSDRSESVTITTLAESPLSDSWIEHDDVSALPEWNTYTQIAFNNKLWLYKGRSSTGYSSDIWSSYDGIEWSKSSTSAAYGERRLKYFTVHAGRLFMVAGAPSTGGYTNDVWSSENGVDWVLETNNAGFQHRSSGATLTSFDGKLWLIGGYGRNPDGSYDDKLSDVWSSVDGKIWQQVTSAAAFGKRTNHQAYVVNDRLYIVGGSGSSDDGIDGVHSDLWSSPDGVSWTRVVDEVAFGPREDHSIVRFEDRLWLFGGRRTIAYEYRYVNASEDFSEVYYRDINEDDAWVSDDGEHWTLYEETTGLPYASERTAVNFNNRIWLTDPSNTRFSTNYNYLPQKPAGSVFISGSAVKGGTIEADLTSIEEALNSSRVTYHWFKNNIELPSERDLLLVINEFDIGDEIRLIVRYANETQQLWEYGAETLTIGTNPIASDFEIGAVTGAIAQQGLTNTLSDWEPSYSVAYASADYGVVTVTGNDEDVFITPVSVGATNISATISDSVSGASKTVSFNITVGQAAQNISFSVAQLSKSDDSADFSVALSQLGLGSGALSFVSSNSSVATVAKNGVLVDVHILDVGEATITANKLGDSNYSPGSASFVLNVFDGDSDGDGIGDDVDNCVAVQNADQSNLDGDTLGDACDPDDDGDFVIDTGDCAPIDVQRWLNRNGFSDVDADGIGAGLSISVCSGQVVPAPFTETSGDNCPTDSNPDQANYDGDSEGDVCDLNDDNDAVNDALDCASLDEAKWQLLSGYLDVDFDDIGYGMIDQVCSGEMIPADYAQSTGDNCQFDSNPNQENADSDPYGDACDPDDDNDNVLDGDDNCIVTANPDQADSDMNGVGDVCEPEGANELCIPIKTKVGTVVLVCL
jgi:fibronectin type 3 domain-containing protein